jgi:type II secretory ATPase GspE/PulE/Tfp pilus assembly ATPase PilB-like protein
MAAKSATARRLMYFMSYLGLLNERLGKILLHFYTKSKNRSSGRAMPRQAGATIWPMPAIFDDDKRNKIVEEMYRREAEDVARILAEHHKIPYADLSLVSIDTDGLRLVPEDQARAAKIAVFSQTGKKLRAAVAAPSREDTRAILRDLENRGNSIEVYMVSENSLTRAWDRYKEIAFSTETKAGSLDIQNESVAAFVNEVRSLDDVRRLIAETLAQGRGFRTSRIAEILLAGAIAIDASDIHIEPEKEGVRVRYRLDGVLVEITRLDEDTNRLLLSRIKLLSGMKINVKGSAQDGRFTVTIGGQDYEIRSSILPGAYSETVVMRILNPDTISVPLEQLGIDPELLAIFMSEIDRPDGMVLNTGPTGSGKTTTLYAFMKKKLEPGIKMITIEDPIEYHVAGLVQTQVDRKRGYDFASGLKHSLRQDPDIIMVGEIRDLETAETAVHAALTGHLVFSTLHTNNAAGAFPRLIDLGVNPKVMTSAIRLSIAQRLVRRLCQECRKPAKLTARQIEVAKRVYDSSPKKPMPFSEDVWQAGGCLKCNGTGFKGRIGIFEAVRIDAAIEAALQMNPSEREIKDAAASQGIPDMAQDGVLKALAGITTIEEVERVVSLDTREGKAGTEPITEEASPATPAVDESGVPTDFSPTA